MLNPYHDYFKSHYKIKNALFDVQEHRKWFWPYWNFLKKHIELHPQDKILEIGAGYGVFYSYLPYTEHYIGLELDPDACLYANRYFQTNTFVEKKFETVSNTEKFDYIFAFEVLEHLEQPFEQIERMATMLGDSGTFVGTTPYPFAKNIIDPTHVYVLHPDNWKKLFLRAGFQTVSVYPMTFLPLIWHIHKRLNIRIPFYISQKMMVSTALIIASK